ncbi:YceI family protein [Winogradskyella tangerina]|uniref:YceI family protein n=1 Tax=Winogradskyella tangerina TaxID=2023240 RepID=UPI000DBE6C9A|nr:YceI family protein [Winogradskyella tangerina]
MVKQLLFGFAFLLLSFTAPEEYITRQGTVTFFSYTNVENIQATNNQVLSLFKPNDSAIAVSILMRAFVFEKSLMQEHFNESYIESDLYPKATFEGSIIDFDPSFEGEQTRIVKGDFTLKDVTMEREIKVKITKSETGYTIEGDFNVSIKDHNIKVPGLLSPNIAETINVSFNFQYEPYEN